jgi:hybrid polyketide synthase / nonribosomal peptide synthetase ACE1
MAIEIGPHAALKGPVLETLKASIDGGEPVPYVGLLHRGKDDVGAFCTALGDLWSRVSSPATVVDFATVDSTASSGNRGLLKDLPTYHWDHERLYWHESRTSRSKATANNPPHPLLGTRTTDVTEDEIRWKNLLKLSEMPWVRGHRLQGQVVYPATAYLSTAVEAARCLVPADKNIAVIEIQDFSIGKPLVFGDNDAGVETLFTLHGIAKEGDNSYVASFSYHASAKVEADRLTTHATGTLRVTMGETHARWLPSREDDPPNLSAVPEDLFYSLLEPIGYGYSEDFRTLSSLQRKLDYSSSTVGAPAQDGEPVQILLHPAMLDTALQGIFLAYSFPIS